MDFGVCVVWCVKPSKVLDSVKGEVGEEEEGVVDEECSQKLKGELTTAGSCWGESACKLERRR